MGQLTTPSTPASGMVFTDVGENHIAADWIEDLHALQYTGGCAAGKYCPSQGVTNEVFQTLLDLVFPPQ